MLLLMWCAVGLLVGMCVQRRFAALALEAAVWAVSMATIAAGSGSSLWLDRDSAGVFATFAAGVLGCALGMLVRTHRRAASN